MDLYLLPPTLPVLANFITIQHFRKLPKLNGQPPAAVMVGTAQGDVIAGCVLVPQGGVVVAEHFVTSPFFAWRDRYYATVLCARAVATFGTAHNRDVVVDGAPKGLRTLLRRLGWVDSGMISLVVEGGTFDVRHPGLHVGPTPAKKAPASQAEPAGATAESTMEQGRVRAGSVAAARRTSKKRRSKP